MELVFVFFMFLLLLSMISEVPEFSLKLHDANGVSIDEEDAMDFEETMAAEFREEDLAQCIADIKQMPGLFIPVVVPNNQCEDEHVDEVGKKNIPENQGLVSGNQVKGKPADGSMPFLELGGDLVKEVYSGGQNKSVRKVEWVRK